MTNRFISYVTIISIITVYVIAWFIQQHLFLNWDVSSLLVTTEQLLNGKEYAKDFFVPNPPMTLYLYAPSIFLGHMTKISQPVIFPIYIFALATLSLALCYFLLNQSKSIGSQSMVNGLTILLALLFLILPLCELGQRDHLLFVLALPYCILVANRLDGTKPDISISVLTGILLAICVGMKPQFVITPALVELFYLYRSKTIPGIARPETIASATILIIYAFSTCFSHPGYLNVITPYVLQHYYPALKQPWPELLMYPWLPYCLLPIFAYLLLEKNQKKNLDDILFISLISFIASYFSQRTTFPHHFIPVVSCATLLSAMMLQRLKLHISKHQIACVCLLTVAILASLHTITWSWLAYNIEPGKTLITIFICLLALTCTFTTSSLKIFPRILIVLLNVCFYLTPFIYVYSTYQLRLAYKNDLLKPMMAYAKKIPANKSLYFISAATYYSSPLIHYTNHRIIQRFDCFWMVNEVINNIHTYGDNFIRRSFANNNPPVFILNNIISDINNQKPDYIFIDMKKHDRYQPDKPFNLLSYLLENSKFRLALSQYHFIGSIHGSHRMLFQLDVYEHNTGTRYD